MRIVEVSHHAITPYDAGNTPAIDGASTAWRNDEYVKKHYFAFTTLRYNRHDGYLYCGVTNFGSDLLHRFDPRTKQFESMKFAGAPFVEKFDIKLHRSVEVGNDGSVYGATSCLHNVDERMDGVGGKLFRFDPVGRTYSLLSIPREYDYIQTISLDDVRGMLYGFTYPVFHFFAFSIKENRVVFCNYMASISHISAIDDNGCYWGTWGLGLHNLFHYDPTVNRVIYHRHGFPEKCLSLMYPDAGPIDCMVNGRDGFLYVATENGHLYRLNPRDASLEFLGKPFPGTRMPGLILGDDGLLYGCGGDDNTCVVFTYDRTRRAFDILGNIVDSKQNLPCYRTHDIAKIGDTLYVAETDNPKGGQYLWECRIDEDRRRG